MKMQFYISFNTKRILELLWPWWVTTKKRTKRLPTHYCSFLGAKFYQLSFLDTGSTLHKLYSPSKPPSKKCPSSQKGLHYPTCKIFTALTLQPFCNQNATKKHLLKMLAVSTLQDIGIGYSEKCVQHPILADSTLQKIYPL